MLKLFSRLMAEAGAIVLFSFTMAPALLAYFGLISEAEAVSYAVAGGIAGLGGVAIGFIGGGLKL